VDDEPFGTAFPKARAALSYAEERHVGQRRKCDGGPFILHPLEVGKLLRDVGERDELVAAGLLHDVIEKAGAQPAELRRQFGSRITALVVTVSENPALASYAQRKAALREQVADAGEGALKLFAADKVSKVRELLVYEIAPPARRLAHYRRSVELLALLLPDYPLTRELATDFARLERVLALGSSRR
jgi:(p)ppGpp synthase/HD superfamily hydrolase